MLMAHPQEPDSDDIHEHLGPCLRQCLLLERMVKRSWTVVLGGTPCSTVPLQLTWKRRCAPFLA